jgi:DNA polymerase (family 10)
MKNFEVTRQFELMADVLELKGENPFRIRAYRRAAQSLESLSEDIETVAREDRLEDIPGIGADLAGKIQEYLRTGKIKEIAAASKGTPRGVVELMNIPGIGPRTARLLYEREHITDIRQLEKRASKGGLRGLPGIQAKTDRTSSRASGSSAAARSGCRSVTPCRSGASSPAASKSWPRSSRSASRAQSAG